ncbi:glycosyltransferase [Cellulomonas fimi]|uniref:glycosyltransferase n=1 Tax=Cellulomonas fimi TaxID=1708 RepID=UPI002359B74C|nr:glycosyltransferase [Cellulomonas fimi]
MRVLLATPYDPAVVHQHAADDVGRPFLAALATLVELHVYAPGATPRSAEGYVVHGGVRPSTAPSRHLGVLPAAVRKDWGRANDAEFGRLRRMLVPDRTHFEYLQTFGAALSQPDDRWSITLHDVSSTVFSQRARATHGAERAYRRVEAVRVAALERRALGRARQAFALSERDVRQIAPATREPVLLRLGVDRPDVAWTHRRTDAPTFVFAGAMWRDANARAARYLVDEVMPHLSAACSTARLRIVGAGPPADLVARSSANVDVVGAVPDFDDEFFAADATIAISLVDAGVLLKAVRAMRCGAPVVLNSTAAEPLAIEDGVHALVRDDPAQLAAALLALWRDEDLATRLGSAGAAHVVARGDWHRTAEDFVRALREQP